MISEKINEALNRQINREFYSGYLYMSMSAYLRESGLFGFAQWTKLQASEELEHGEKIFNYLIDRKGRVELEAIQKPEFNFDGPVKLFEFIYNHERSITKSVMSIAEQAEEECDRMTSMFIDWYINEQVEEEYQVHRIIEQLRCFGEDRSSLYLIDKEAGERSSCKCSDRT
ncbi:MAG: ferritin [Candidatus Gastranaerophilales bacterium]|nr:ferritin [Candidatus Gastranaerophilales bacterium]